MKQQELYTYVKNIITKDRIMTNLADRHAYSYDASFGEYLPDIIVQPEDKYEVADIIKSANKHRFPVYPRGSATSLSGGSLAVHGGLILDMSKFKRKLVVDPENLLAVVSPSVITSDLHRKVEDNGLFYPPDPSSSHGATIGGNLLEIYR